MNMNRRDVLAAVLSVPLLGVGSSCVRAERIGVYSPGGMAIGGFDPVAYFDEGRAVQGRARHMLKWHGTTWVFASAANQEAFEMNPAAYAPQYGGFCALSVSNGGTVDAEPRVWAIVEGRLYLFYSERAHSVWNQAVPEHIRRADAHWSAMSGD